MGLQPENTPNKTGKNTIDMYMYIANIQVHTSMQPNGSSLYKDV